MITTHDLRDVAEPGFTAQERRRGSLRERGVPGVYVMPTAGDARNLARERRERGLEAEWHPRVIRIEGQRVIVYVVVVAP